MMKAFSLKSIAASLALCGFVGVGTASAVQAVFGSPVVEGPFVYDTGDGSVDLYVVGQPVRNVGLTGLNLAPTSSLTATPTSWTGAEAQAEGQGGHLVTIGSAAENSFIVNNVLQDFSGKGGPNLTDVPLWIGLSDPTGAASDDGGPSHAGNFVWADGSSSTYRNWNTSTSEPNDASPGEYYAAIQWHFADQQTTDHGTWNDAPNGGTQGYFPATDGPYFGIMAVNAPTAAPLPAAWAMGLAGISLMAAGVVRSRRRVAIA